ncbi:MAG: hypothetical protein NZ921_02090 [Candidatus Caldarchaeum sp.]|nr:hypothetical protein [Candidatus Caldarchaeum sp.]
MSLVFEVWDGSAWLDKTGKLTDLRHRVAAKSLEELGFTLVDESLSVGSRCRYRRGSNVIFEGVVYEVNRRHEGGRVREISCGAYTDLILYERHIVFREYSTGTRAGTIIKDLASLESGVNVSNVDETSTPALNTPWTIQNAKALDVMMDVARGTNYWLRMRPGKILFFKPRSTGTPAATISGSIVLNADYAEDRWKQRNRVIYVGANGHVLADVSEGPGDMPEVVHDPFLTDQNEALRRAQTRLAMNREYGRQLRLEMMQSDFLSLNIDLGNTVTVNLPSVGLSNVNMYVVEIEYDPSRLRYYVTVGGRLELFEEYLDEALGGDVASRFGGTVSVPEYVSTIVSAQNAALKIQADARTLRLVNKAPILLSNAINVVLDDDGFVRLASSHTSGSFITWYTPGELFSRWLRVHYGFEAGGGSVSADIVDASGQTIVSNVPRDYEFRYYPQTGGWLTEMTANEWTCVNGSVSDSQNAVISFWSIRATRTSGSSMKVIYPRQQNLGLSLSGFRHFVIYLYSLADDSNLKIRLIENASKYHETIINHKGLAWRRYQIKLDTMTKVGGGASVLNWLEIETSLPTLYVDSDYILIPAGREKIGVKLNLSRPSASAASPRVSLVKLVWREA